MTDTLRTDVLIVGGGIAGLWLLARLRQQGYSALLLERDALGCGQSIASQGIIHGGAKYALSGTVTQAANAIADMPGLWRACLAGKGEVDLRAAGILSQHHYLWSTGQLGSRMTAFFASKAVRGRVQAAAGEEIPVAFRDPAFKGSLYQLDEVVLDVPSVFAALAGQYAGCALQAHCTAEQITTAAPGDVQAIQAGGVRIEAQRFVFTAGAGNAELIQGSGLPGPAMQIRPLNMVMVHHRHPHPIYAHCLGTGSKPRVTITSHPHPDGSWTWYAGGDLAETGVDRDDDAQIKLAQKELANVLPWINLQDAGWACLRIDRAEPAQSAKARPDNAYTAAQGNVIVGWPTKLALSPNLANDVIATLKEQGVTPQHPQPESTGLPAARVAATAWSGRFPS